MYRIFPALLDVYLLLTVQRPVKFREMCHTDDELTGGQLALSIEGMRVSGSSISPYDGMHMNSGRSRGSGQDAMIDGEEIDRKKLSPNNSRDRTERTTGEVNYRGRGRKEVRIEVCKQSCILSLHVYSDFLIH